MQLPYEDDSFDVVLIAPNFVEHKGTPGGRIWSGILVLAGVRFEHQWSAQEYLDFLADSGRHVAFSKEMAARIAMMDTECEKMKYTGMPEGMWLLFQRSFRKEMVSVLGYSEAAAAETEKKALRKYKEIIVGLPEFEKGDRFKMNIVSCAMLAAFYLNMEHKPTLEQMTAYYAKAMMIVPMRAFCRIAGKKKFSEKDVNGMRATAALNAADRNPYSWNMEFLPYPDGSGYEARFSKCGICTLMRELGISEIVPAMCALDYTMSEAGGTTEFVRQYTLAGGGPYCDCGYKKRGR